MEEFTNSIWENFLGSQIQITKTHEKDGSWKKTNTNVNKMGPIQLNIENENLYSGWEASRKNMITDNSSLKDG